MIEEINNNSSSTTDTITPMADDPVEEEAITDVEAEAEAYATSAISNDMYLDLDAYAKPPAELTGEEPKESYEDFVSKAVTLREVTDNAQWSLGDLLHKMGEDLGDVKNANGKTPQDMLAADINEKPGTLRQYRWVSEKFPRREDRQTGLSWSHYRHCASTGDPMSWINKAVDNNWTSAQLKNEIQVAEDSTTVQLGRPCEHCGGPLPEEGSLHVRRGKEKRSFCCIECMLGYWVAIFKQERAEQAVA